MKTCRDILSIAGIILGFQLLVICKPITNPKKTLIGFIYVTLGITLFLEGLELAPLPLGKLMATQLTTPEFLNIDPNQQAIPWQAYHWIYVFAASIGFATAFAEPSLLAVAYKAEEISRAIQSLGLRIAVSRGVAFGITLVRFGL